VPRLHTSVHTNKMYFTKLSGMCMGHDLGVFDVKIGL
jgi:hypothetical protein